MITEKQIVSGEVTYTLDQLYENIGELVCGMDKAENQKEHMTNSLLLFIMLSAEDKPTDVIAEAFHMTKKQIEGGQDAFKQQIDICRAIHMRKFLDIFRDYMTTTSMTINLLNLWIHDFIKTHIKENNYATA